MEESEREQIIELYKELKSGHKVAKHVDWSKATVYNVIRDAGVCRSVQEAQKDRRKELSDEHSEMDEKLAYIYGVLLGDGYIFDVGAGLETIDEEFRNRFKQFGEEKFGIEGNNYFHEGRPMTGEGERWDYDTKGRYLVKFCSTNLNEYLEKTDIKQEITKLEKRQYQIEALKGLWDSDGSLNVEGGQVLFYKQDKEIIEVYEHLLDELFDFNYNTRWGSNNAYVCYFGTKESVRKFYEEVNPTIERKNEKLEQMI